MRQDELTYIKIPYPNANARDLHFKITAPLCWLVINPGIGNAWATGKYTDAYTVVPLHVSHNGNTAEVVSVGALAYKVTTAQLPHLNLSFGRSKPFSLSIAAGDLKDQFDFGGLPLSSLDIQYDGSGEQIIDFSYPNPQVMDKMRIAAGAGMIQIENLANANAAEIRLNGDSTCYRINFGGELKQNTVLHIGSTVSRVAVNIPASAAIKINAADTPLGTSMDDFMYENKMYLNGPARDHQKPLLYITAPYTPLSIHTNEASRQDDDSQQSTKRG